MTSCTGAAAAGAACAVTAVLLLCSCVLMPVLGVTLYATRSHRCMHDEINRGNAESRRYERYGHAKRDMPAGGCTVPEISARGQFQQLRINISYVNMGTFFKNATILQIIQTQLARVVDRLSAILAVYPVNGTLVLPRVTTCSGSNQDGCPQLCGQEPTITIPDWYMASNTSGGGGSRGVPGSDVVIFVSGSTSAYCSSVLAYTIVCRRNNVGRPIAATIQLCPQPFIDLKEDFIYQVLLHEMLHALAFSLDSFNAFVDYSSSSCANYRNPVRSNLEVLKLVTPTTLRAASSYFSCINPSAQFNEFGGPLYSIIGADNLVGSHWNQTQMLGSLMTSNIPPARVVSLDIITLSVFEDSGWYIVNYSFAQPFVFGKHAGCSFATADYCKSDTVYFCSQLNTIGCHYLHRDKGICSRFDTTSSCYSYVVGPQTACYDPQNPSALNASLTGESYDISSRCFMSSVWPADKTGNATNLLVGRCYQHACNGSSLLLRAWNMTGWLACPYNTTIKVDMPGYAGVIQCPISGILCSDADTVASSTAVSLPTAMTVTTTWTSAMSGTSPSHDGSQKLMLLFPTLNLTGQQPDSAATFRDAVSSEISRLANVPAARLVSCNVTAVTDGNGTYYTCNVVDSATGSPNDISAADVVKLVYGVVSAGQFNITIWSRNYVASLVDASSTPATEHPKLPDKNSAAPVAIGVALCIAAVFVALILTFVCLRRRRRRAAAAMVALASKGASKDAYNISFISVPAVTATGDDRYNEPRC